MGKKYSLKKPDTFKTRFKNNKKIAIRLLVSLVVFLSVYFSLIRKGFYAVQTVYIFVSSVLMAMYCICSLYVAKIKQDKKESDLTQKEKDTIIKLDAARKNLLVIFLPMFASVVIDALILFYDNLGISQYLGI